MRRLHFPHKLLKAGIISLSLLVPFSVIASDNNDTQYQQTLPSEAELAQMLAPIALYPDSLLTHILIASTYPLEVVQARRWEEQHKHLSSEQKMLQAESQSWDPSVTALVAFPTVLEKLNEDLAWTQHLGEAFLQDEASVLASIQTLRQQADDADSFDNMDNMTVTRVEKQIIIEPAKPEVIYVPVYDPRIVYGHWRWHAYPPVYWHYPAYAYYRPHRPIYWGPSVYINFNYFFGAVHWSHHRVVVVNHRHTRYYRKPHKIAYSSGSKRWKHNPTHRRGVAYKSPKVSHRYDKLRHNKVKVAHHSTKHGIKSSQLNKSHYAKQSQQQRVNKALKHNKAHAVSKSVKSDKAYKATTANKAAHLNRSTHVNNSAHGKKSAHKSTAYKSPSNVKASSHQNKVKSHQMKTAASSKQYASNRTSATRSSTHKTMTQSRNSSYKASTQRMSSQRSTAQRSHRTSAPKQKVR
ncbi:MULTISPECIES: DUF3300 domain-containing protein [Shewanella]|uniref:DUF3300 domain-containing protein n=1 Tax=Shewanella TaxID=22 RepID=UPI000E76711D|nr:DUF3300 domain-containing protein [Shewanella japonica]